MAFKFLLQILPFFLYIQQTNGDSSNKENIFANLSENYVTQKSYSTLEKSSENEKPIVTFREEYKFNFADSKNTTSLKIPSFTHHVIVKRDESGVLQVHDLQAKKIKTDKLYAKHVDADIVKAEKVKSIVLSIGKAFSLHKVSNPKGEAETLVLDRDGPDQTDASVTIVLEREGHPLSINGHSLHEDEKQNLINVKNSFLKEKSRKKRFYDQSRSDSYDNGKKIFPDNIIGRKTGLKPWEKEKLLMSYWKEKKYHHEKQKEYLRDKQFEKRFSLSPSNKSFGRNKQRDKPFEKRFTMTPGRNITKQYKQKQALRDDQFEKRFTMTPGRNITRQYKQKQALIDDQFEKRFTMTSGRNITKQYKQKQPLRDDQFEKRFTLSPKLKNSPNVETRAIEEPISNVIYNKVTVQSKPMVLAKKLIQQRPKETISVFVNRNQIQTTDHYTPLVNNVKNVFHSESMSDDKENENTISSRRDYTTVRGENPENIRFNFSDNIYSPSENNTKYVDSNYSSFDSNFKNKVSSLSSSESDDREFISDERSSSSENESDLEWRNYYRRNKKIPRRSFGRAKNSVRRNNNRKVKNRRQKFFSFDSDDSSWREPSKISKGSSRRKRKFSDDEDNKFNSFDSDTDSDGQRDRRKMSRSKSSRRRKSRRGNTFSSDGDIFSSFDSDVDSDRQKYSRKFSSSKASNERKYRKSSLFKDDSDDEFRSFDSDTDSNWRRGHRKNSRQPFSRSNSLNERKYRKDSILNDNDDIFNSFESDNDSDWGRDRRQMSRKPFSQNKSSKTRKYRKSSIFKDDSDDNFSSFENDVDSVWRRGRRKMSRKPLSNRRKYRKGSFFTDDSDDTFSSFESDNDLARRSGRRQMSRNPLARFKTLNGRKNRKDFFSSDSDDKEDIRSFDSNEDFTWNKNRRKMSLKPFSEATTSLRRRKSYDNDDDYYDDYTDENQSGLFESYESSDERQTYQNSENDGQMPIKDKYLNNYFNDNYNDGYNGRLNNNNVRVKNSFSNKNGDFYADANSKVSKKTNFWFKKRDFSNNGRYRNTRNQVVRHGIRRPFTQRSRFMTYDNDNSSYKNTRNRFYEKRKPFLISMPKMSEFVHEPVDKNATKTSQSDTAVETSNNENNLLAESENPDQSNKQFTVTKNVSTRRDGFFSESAENWIYDSEDYSDEFYSSEQKDNSTSNVTTHN